MEIIDAHVHFSNIKSFADCAEYSSLLDYSARGYADAAGACGIVRSVCMGLTETTPSAFPDADARTPMTADLSENLPPGMVVCPGINPLTLDGRAVGELAELAVSGAAAGFKIYPGYYGVDVCDPVYDPVYSLALRYDLPVAIHAGETYSERGLLEYSHPLRIDRLAVGRPDMKIVICHMGAPWVFDACETAGKNRSVYIDISGLLVGSAEYIGRMSAKKLLLERYIQPLIMMDNYKKVLFGTDWPLAPFDEYIGFCKKIVPEEAYEDVFHNNAAAVYTAIRG